ncbi:hypothetical protein J6590_090361 [Homalodisca vitripennis]|nr:hypothetical protein J6590_090361 [Homalodisca vitripennis]
MKNRYFDHATVEMRQREAIPATAGSILQPYSGNLLLPTVFVTRLLKMYPSWI